MRSFPPKTRARVGVGLLAAAAVLAVAPGAWFALPAMAASATSVDLSPEHGSDARGTEMTLVARVFDEDGNLFTGPGSNARVRFYFLSGSANDPSPPGDSPAGDCWTGDLGECTITFSIASLGTDTVCAVIAGGSYQCDEPVGDAELDDRVDVVVHETTGDEPPPEPKTDPSPSPPPSSSPSASPTSPPDEDPAPSEASPSPSPSVSPSPSPSPSPTQVPSPISLPSPTPVPSPPPSPSPTQVPGPIPTPSPSLMPSPSPSPSPTQVPSPTDAPSPTDVPSPTPPPSHDATDPPDTTSTPTGPTPTVSPATAGLADDDRSEPGTSAPPALLAFSSTGGSAGAGGAGPGAGGLLVRGRGGSGSTDPNGAIFESLGIVGSFVLRFADEVRATVRPAAVQAVAQTFSFPLALMVAVLLFLVVQHRLDRRDPKLRSGPAAGAEIVIPFVEEPDLR